MAVTNFRKEDFSKGKKIKEQHNSVREDNKILNTELDKAVRDAKEGEKAADASVKKNAAAEKTLSDEIQKTVDEGSNEEQTKSAPKKATKSTK